MWNGFSDELHSKLDVRNTTKYGGWGRERFVRLENGHFASKDNAECKVLQKQFQGLKFVHKFTK